MRRFPLLILVSGISSVAPYILNRIGQHYAGAAGGLVALWSWIAGLLFGVGGMLVIRYFDD